MEPVLLEDLRKLPPQYSQATAPDSMNENLICVNCKKLKMDSLKSHCGCIYCHDCAISIFAQGNSFCRGLKGKCKEQLLLFERNIFSSPNISDIILELMVHCPNKLCDYTTQVRLMDRHLRECPENPVKCPFMTIGCGKKEDSKESILNHIHIDATMHSQLLLNVINNLNNEVAELKDSLESSRIAMLSLRELLTVKDMQAGEMVQEMMKQKEESTTQKSEILQLKCELSRICKEESTIRLSNIPAMEEAIGKINTGTNMKVAVGFMHFKVERFNGMQITKEYVLSPYFYSHTNGYKLRLKINVGKHIKKDGTQLSAGFIICVGEYDDILPWPFRHSVRLSVINQINGEEHLTRIYNYSSSVDIDKHVFNKPTAQDNSCYGHNSFISHKSLQAIFGLIYQDSVIIQCSVTAPHE